MKNKPDHSLDSQEMVELSKKGKKAMKNLINTTNRRHANPEAFYAAQRVLIKAFEEAGARKEKKEHKEICICAAVLSTTGKVFRGHRHSDCIRTITTCRFAPSQKDEDQGFITSRNRYVNRAEGYDLQMKAGIKSANSEFSPTGKYCQQGQLYSEDLY